MAGTGLMPGYAPVSGLAEGFRTGLITYMNQKNINQQQQMMGAMHGLIQDPNGNWGPGELMQKENQAKMITADSAIREKTVGNNYAHTMQNYFSPEVEGLDATQMSGGEIKDLAQARLLAKEKAREAAALRMMIAGQKNSNKILPPSTVLTLQDGENLPGLLDDLRGDISTYSQKFGPVAGTIGKMNSYDADAQHVNSKIQAVRQLIGKFLEGGVLRKEDEIKYSQMLSELSDTPETAWDKANNIESILIDRYNAYIRAMGASGYNMAGFNPINKRQPKGFLNAKPQSAPTSSIDAEALNKMTPTQQLEYLKTHDMKMSGGKKP